MSSASSITWLLVRMWPSGLTMTPLPKPPELSSASPSKKRDHWSVLPELRFLLVLMLTTAGDALRAGPLRLPAGRFSSEPAGACSSVMPSAERWALRIHSGLSVATTNQAAIKTVTHCEKKSQ